MMKTVWIMVLLIALPLVAVSSDKGRSIMFEEEPNVLSPKEQPEAEDEQQKYCKELSERIKKLKGKPQRRYAAIQRHKAECLRDVRP